MKFFASPFLAFILISPSLPAVLPPPPEPTVTDLQLLGDVSDGRAQFTLSATAQVNEKHGANLVVLTGPVALVDVASDRKWHVEAKEGQFVIHFDASGKIPFRLNFEAKVRASEGWNEVEFGTVSSPLQPIRLRGLPEDTKLVLAGASRPERHGSEFTSFLAGDGKVKLRWQPSRAETEGKLFYSAEMLSQVSISPGLLKQTAVMDFKVMQGELKTLSFVLVGPGEVTRVQGEHLLAWKLEQSSGAGQSRQLVVEFNEAQREQFSLQIQTQAPLGALPQTVEVLQLRPVAATRFGGYYRISNEGAVRLEITEAVGLSQLSPDQFPQTEESKNLLRGAGTQQFVYRFSGEDIRLTVQADQILPEVTASELIVYHVGASETAIDAEIEAEVREAPLRELVLRVPRGHAPARVNAPGLTDFYLVNSDDPNEAELHALFGQPVTGRLLVQLRLEKPRVATETNWDLPRIDIPRAKSIRGHIATAADAGFRLSSQNTTGLTEIATAFFPRKVAGIQSAFRLSDSVWHTSVAIERLAQTVQSDVLHLFSISEGIAYGSSVINYSISGAPIAGFKVELSDEYFNVEFTGKDIRNWQKVPGGYVVQLHTPIAGPYTLLATYERPFKPQGDTLTFTGARPLDAQTEQGHTLVVSAYQFQVKPIEISPGLLEVQAGELPAEYRLFFDAPVLASYRYTARPFNLRLALSPLAQADSLSLVVDRAVLTTKVSKEGQVVTDVRYFVKNRGNPHLNIRLPVGTSLWAASVNGTPVVPVKEGQSNLIPMPAGANPGSVVTVDLKVATGVSKQTDIRIASPVVEAPVMLAQWKLSPDTGQRLEYRGGSLTPMGGETDDSGFAQIARCLQRSQVPRTLFTGLLPFALVMAAVYLFWWGSRAQARFSSRHIAGLLFGVAALVLAAGLLSRFVEQVGQEVTHAPRELTFVAPVQQAGSSITLRLLNVEELRPVWAPLQLAWPALLALPLWAVAVIRKELPWRQSAIAGGWLLCGWAALRSPNGGLLFLGILFACLVFRVLIPALVHWWHRPPELGNSVSSATGAVTAAHLLLAGIVLMETQHAASARPARCVLTTGPAMAELVSQEIRVEDGFVNSIATIRWQARKDQVLPLLFSPAVLTHLEFPTDAMKLEQITSQSTNNQTLVHRLTAKRDGSYELKLQYETPVAQRNGATGFYLPIQPGLVNRLKLVVVNSEVEVSSTEATDIISETVGSNTVASATLAPSPGVWVGWHPRRRDVKHEKTVFYADLAQLYVPTAGVIEGEHVVSIRLAQGELKEVMFDVPAGLTITDVSESPGESLENAAPQQGRIPSLCVWRFDPTKHKLRVSLASARSGTFTLKVRSQAACGPLPVEQTLGLLSVNDAAAQVGMVGLATGNEVQLDSAKPDGLSPINLEDYPTNLVANLQTQIPGLTLRRAFRYSNSSGTFTLKASPVEPDIRVESQDTVSLGEDRTILAANSAVSINRAGVFRLSFVLPPNFDVESISGPALSHWTEARNSTNRVITLHLTGKTEGRQQFAISLAGPGVRATNGWVAPQLSFREASKHSGTLLLVPEQGLKLQVNAAEGLTQMDPHKAGIKERGVLAFRVLEATRRLALTIDQVDPWIQVNTLQHVMVDDAQLKTSVNLQYQIENTGVKNFHVWIPTNAEGVQFQGEQVSDYLSLAGATTNGLQSWEVRLHRRVIGSFMLQLKYQVSVPRGPGDVRVRGVRVGDVNVQRGFVTVQATGRLQVRVDATPQTVQAAEWQSIPRVLQQGLPETAANFSYRLVQPDFELPLRIERYEAAQLLPGRVRSLAFTSVVSDDGVILTRASLEMLPGEKRLLRMRLPQAAHFWFAFVNEAGVWPWREQDEILIPLEQQSLPNKTIPVEIFYTCKLGDTSRHALNLDLVAPEFDLPLENISWRVSLSEKWELKSSSGTMQLSQQEVVPSNLSLDLEQYLQSETNERKERTKQAEDLLNAANSALAQGDPQQARRALQTAFGLSAHDAAFNEDARVQLHNVKLQEALVGLNVRQAGIAGGEASSSAKKLRELRDGRVASYSQQDAKDILDRNSSDENAAFMRVAERLIQQEDAALSTPAAIRAGIPEQGRVLTFKRAVLIDPWAKLNIRLTATARDGASASARISILIAALVIFVLAGGFASRLLETQHRPTATT